MSEKPEYEQFFEQFGALPVQFQTHVYGAPVTIESLYQAFAARYRDESVGDKSPRASTKPPKVKPAPIKEPELFDGTTEVPALDLDAPGGGIEEEPPA